MSRRRATSPTATLSGAPVLSIVRASRPTYLDSPSSVIPSSFARFLCSGQNRSFRTDIWEASASFIPCVAFLTTISVTSVPRRFKNLPKGLASSSCDVRSCDKSHLQGIQASSEIALSNSDQSCQSSRVRLQPFPLANLSKSLHEMHVSSPRQPDNTSVCPQFRERGSIEIVANADYRSQ